jgi:hypothetical protein
VSLATHVQPILTSKCATQLCHGSTPPAQNLDLRVGASYRAMVGVNSTQCTGTKLVAPGDPNNSYVIWKIKNSGPCLLGGRMPPAAPLSAANMSTITAWIEQGALDN